MIHLQNNCVVQVENPTGRVKLSKGQVDKSLGKFSNPDSSRKEGEDNKMALSSLAPSSLTGRALGVCAGIGAAAFLGYCIYFDHSRRYGIVLWFKWGNARPIRIRTVGLYLSTYWAISVIMPTRLAMPVQHCQI